MARDLGIVPVSDGKFYFISYNSEDADRVSEYVNEIVDQGLRIWYDRGIKTGMLWKEEMDMAYIHRQQGIYLKEFG